MITAVNGVLCDENGVLTNFKPTIKGVFAENNDPQKIWFQIKILQGERCTIVEPMPYHKLDKLRFDSISPVFQCLDASGSQTDRLVRNYLRAVIAKKLQSEDPGILFSQMGWHTLADGRHVYVAGDQVIGDVDGLDYTLAPSLSQIKMLNAYESDLSLTEKFLKVVKKRADVIIPLIAYCIRSLLITPFAEAGYPLHFVIYLVGEQGIGKTTTAQKFSLSFDQYSPVQSPVGIIDAGSTPSSLRAVFDQLHDMPVILDDVAITTDPQERRKRESTASQLVRFIANDNGVLRMQGKRTQHLQGGCGMIVTAELPLKSASDITRCAIVGVFDQMKSFTHDDRTLTAAVMSRFIGFFAANYDRFLENIRQRLQNIEGKEECPRQRQIYEELSLCFELLLKYGREVGALSGSEEKMLRKKAEEAFGLAFAHNCDLLDELEKKSLKNLAKIIVEAINNEELNIAKSPEKYSQKPKIYDGLKASGIMCISPNALAKYLSQFAGERISENELGKRLRACGLVEENAEGRTASWKRNGYPRMIPFDWKMLKSKSKMAKI